MYAAVKRGRKGTPMNANRLLLAALLLGAATGAGATEIFRCKSPGGSVTYQQQPCGPAADGGAVSIPVTYPDHVAERDRLAAREAAMDARLLKRLEIESAERIARDNRIAKEKEAQAERERTERERAQTNAPLFIVGMRERHRAAPRRPWYTGR